MKPPIIKKIRKMLRPVKRLWIKHQGHKALAATARTFQNPPPYKPHTLPGELVVSLTSHAPRFGTILPTLQCLLTQTVKPDRVILWLGHDDVAKLPQSVVDLQTRGLEVRGTEDVRSHTKLIPALSAFPDAFIATADDDSYYAPDWLERLVKGWDGRPNCIVCHDAHRMRYGADGNLIAYNDWQWNLKGPNDDKAVFPLGFGGILYPPRVLLMPDTLDSETFLRLSPGADDLWFFWMGRRNGAVYKQTDYNKTQIVWPASQEVSLSVPNTGRYTGISPYDDRIAALVKAYGLP